MNLDTLAYKLIIELRKTPLATLRELGDKLGVSANTARSRLLDLKSQGLIREDDTIDDPVLGKRQITEVVAHHAPHQLGLKRHHVILEDLLVSKKVLLDLLDKYPYTYYRITGMGHHSIIYAIFDLPSDGIKLFEDFLQRLVDQNFITTFKIVNPISYAKSQDDLELWLEESGWNISITSSRSGEKSILEMYTSYLDDTKGIDQNLYAHSVPRMDEIDLKLLRELTVNSKVQPTHIASEYQKERSTLSRRLSKIKANYVEGYSLIYDRKKFNLDTIFLLYGKIERKQNVALLRLIQSGAIPYLSNFFMDNQGNFIWHLYAPTLFCNEIIHYLFESSDDLHLNLLNPLDGIRYYFYPGNYDTSSKSWKVSSSYMIDNIL